MSLSYLTDSQLLLDIKNLVSDERKLTHKIIEHLEEIEARKLYSDLKCSSLYDLVIEHEEKKVTVQKKSHAPSQVSRYIPKAVKTHAYKSAGGKCAICGSNHHLNFNHKTAYALGGTNSKENINLLCHNCNQRQRVVDFGVVSIFKE